MSENRFNPVRVGYFGNRIPGVMRRINTALNDLNPFRIYTLACADEPLTGACDFAEAGDGNGAPFNFAAWA